MSAQEKLRRQVSCLYNEGCDPYNTADTVRVSTELADDFVTWVQGPTEPGVMQPQGLMVRQAD